MSRRRIVLASNNAAKLREMSMTLQGSAWDARWPQANSGVDAADEPHSTFVENALAKARHASALTGMPALADDSGLCVDRFERCTRRLVRALCGRVRQMIRATTRSCCGDSLASQTESAHYTCVLVAIRTADDPEPLIVEARWYGEIAQAPRGNGGFGYDPVFYLPSLGVTAAELDPAHKNRISHRGLAMQDLAQKLVGWR